MLLWTRRSSVATCIIGCGRRPTLCRGLNCARSTSFLGSVGIFDILAYQEAMLDLLDP